MKPANFPFWILALFPLYFALMWFGVIFLISRFGWHRLSEFAVRPDYLDNARKRRSFSMGGARIGRANYNNCLLVVVTDDGLYLRPFVFFQMFHPPLLLPWSAFSAPVVRKILWATYVEYTVSMSQGKSVGLCFYSAALWESIEAARTQTPETPFSHVVMSG